MSCTARAGIGEAAVDSIMTDFLFACNELLLGQIPATEKRKIQLQSALSRVKNSIL